MGDWCLKKWEIGVKKWEIGVKKWEIGVKKWEIWASKRAITLRAIGSRYKTRPDCFMSMSCVNLCN